MSPVKRIPLKLRFSRPLIKLGFFILYNVVASMKINGKNNIPKTGPFIITFNHVSIFDPPMLVAFSRQPPEIFGAEYLWGEKIIGTIMRSYGVTPVSRAYFDRKLLNLSLDYLRDGRILTLAPEGKRSMKPGLLKGMPGAAFLAENADVPILPVGIVGATSEMIDNIKKFRRSRIQINFGKPYKLPSISIKNGNRKANRQEKADYVMIKIAELLPKEYQGVYANRV